MKIPGIRPHFEIRTGGPVDAVLAKVEAVACSDDFGVRGWMHPPYAELAVVEQHTHFWCPRLAVHVHEVDETSTTLDCRLQPAPSVWTMYMAGWGMLTVTGMLVVGFGCAQLLMHTTPTVWFAGLPVIAVLGLGLYISAVLGQRLGANEARILIEALHEAVGEDPSGVIEDWEPAGQRVELEPS